MGNVLGRYTMGDRAKTAVCEMLLHRAALVETPTLMGPSALAKSNARFLRIMEAQLRAMATDDTRLLSLELWHLHGKPPSAPLEQWACGKDQSSFLATVGMLSGTSDDLPDPADALSEFVYAALSDLARSVRDKEADARQAKLDAIKEGQAELDAQLAAKDAEVVEAQQQTLTVQGDLALERQLHAATRERLGILEAAFDGINPKPAKRQAAKAAA